MKRHGPWRTLGLDPTEDRSAIRRAYADKLRALDPDQDIEGYTRLRHARVHALTLAKGLAEAGAGALETIEEDAPAEDWSAAVDAEADEAADGELLERADATERPALPEELLEPTPPQVLLTILFPDGETSEAPLSTEEWALAKGALAAILDEADASTIDQHAAIDGWLAHHLASAWPRSAWLVEPAAEAFGWMEESGQLTERPAVQFLNLRLRGLRFVTMVEQPGHPLHKAWTELSNPGPKGAFAFMRVGNDDVAQLLSGIRERYPEVESYLDPQKVASWESSIQGTPWTPWRVVGRILIVVVVLSQLAHLFGTPADRDGVAPPPVAIEMAWNADQVDRLIIELFGERLDNDTLRNKAPALWSNIDRTSGVGGDDPDAEDDARRLLLRQLRAQSQLAAREAGFEELVAIKQVKLALLRAAREQGRIDDCLDFGTQGALSSNVAVPETVRAEERALAARLAAASLLLPSERELPTTASVPGALVEQVIESTGLPEDTVMQAFRGEGSDEVLCNYRIALLEAVLERPGGVSAELLRII